MAVDRDFVALLMEALDPLGGVTWRPMFGGAGIYRDGGFFALAYEDALYLRVDDSTRPRFEAAGSRAFSTGRFRTEKYYQAPAELLDEPETLRAWAEEAFEAARREEASKAAKKRRG